MKSVLDRKYIETLAESENAQFSEKMQEDIANLVGIAVSDLSTRVPFISMDNIILQPVNETFNGAFTPMSKYVYFLGVNSPQIQLNSLNYTASFKKFKERLIKAWNDTKKRKRRRKRKRDQEEKSEPKYQEFQPERYNLDALRRDLQLAFAQNLSVTSIVYNLSDRLVIQGKDDFGSVAQIEIIPVIYDGEVFKYFLSRRKGFLDVNMSERLLNFNMKYEMAGENFFKVLKLMNNLFKNITKESVNQIFVESLLYNVPNEFFEEDDIYTCFVNVINYLNMTDVSEFVSIENKNEKLFKNKLLRGSAGLYTKFIKSI